MSDVCHHVRITTVIDIHHIINTYIIAIKRRTNLMDPAHVQRVIDDYEHDLTAQPSDGMYVKFGPEKEAKMLWRVLHEAKIGLHTGGPTIQLNTLLSLSRTSIILQSMVTRHFPVWKDPEYVSSMDANAANAVSIVKNHYYNSKYYQEPMTKGATKEA
tara:strand:+ start:3043 stop:3516 length:474 start_codon:yes stop_codon:yes gene_type:complete